MTANTVADGHEEVDENAQCRIEAERMLLGKQSVSSRFVTGLAPPSQQSQHAIETKKEIRPGYTEGVSDDGTAQTWEYDFSAGTIRENNDDQPTDDLEFKYQSGDSFFAIEDRHTRVFEGVRYEYIYRSTVLDDGYRHWVNLVRVADDPKSLAVPMGFAWGFRIEE